MIQNKAKYYLYRHIRKDTDEVFYVGIGTKKEQKNRFKTFKHEYSRAYRKSKRNAFWKNVSLKTDYSVEIVLESNCLDFIRNKEIEFINLYGRKVLNTGTLCNLTDGGETSVGYRHSESIKNKMSNNSAMKNRKGEKHPSATVIYKYDLNGNFIKKCVGLCEEAKLIGVDKSLISSCLMREVPCLKLPFMYYNTYKGDKVEIKKRKRDVVRKPPIKLNQFTFDGVFIKQWNSCKEASKFYKTDLLQSLKRGKVTIKGYNWYMVDDVIVTVASKLLNTYKRSVNDSANNAKDESR